ncbi:hypothetical protein ACWDRR_27465 [Kitasatospora sp. NPDC003701]
MTAPDTNSVAIVCVAGRVTATGGDAHAARFLSMCGFTPEPGSDTEPRSLPEGLSDFEQAEQATEAAVLLATAGYEVSLDPALGVRPSPPPFVPVTGGRLPSATKDRLAGEIDDIADHVAHAPDPAEAARALDVLVGEGGVMERTVDALRSVSYFTDAQNSRQDEVADSLGFVAEVMSDLRRLANEAVGRLTPAPASRAKAARLNPSRTPQHGAPQPSHVPPRLHRPDPSSDRGPSR